MLQLIEVNGCGLSVLLNVFLETTITSQIFVNGKNMNGLDLENTLTTCSPESSVIQFA